MENQLIPLIDEHPDLHSDYIKHKPNKPPEIDEFYESKEEMFKANINSIKQEKVADTTCNLLSIPPTKVASKDTSEFNYPRPQSVGKTTQKPISLHNISINKVFNIRHQSVHQNSRLMSLRRLVGRRKSERRNNVSELSNTSRSVHRNCSCSGNFVSSYKLNNASASKIQVKTKLFAFPYQALQRIPLNDFQHTYYTIRKPRTDFTHNRVYPSHKIKSTFIELKIGSLFNKAKGNHNQLNKSNILVVQHKRTEDQNLSQRVTKSQIRNWHN